MLYISSVFLTVQLLYALHLSFSLSFSVKLLVLDFGSSMRHTTSPPNLHLACSVGSYSAGSGCHVSLWAALLTILIFLIVSCHCTVFSARCYALAVLIAHFWIVYIRTLLRDTIVTLTVGCLLPPCSSALFIERSPQLDMLPFPVPGTWSANLIRDHHSSRVLLSLSPD